MNEERISKDDDTSRNSVTPRPSSQDVPRSCRFAQGSWRSLNENVNTPRNSSAFGQFSRNISRPHRSTQALSGPLNETSGENTHFPPPHLIRAYSTEHESHPKTRQYQNSNPSHGQTPPDTPREPSSTRKEEYSFGPRESDDDDLFQCVPRVVGHLFTIDAAPYNAPPSPPADSNSTSGVGGSPTEQDISGYTRNNHKNAWNPLWNLWNLWSQPHPCANWHWYSNTRGRFIDNTRPKEQTDRSHERRTPKQENHDNDPLEYRWQPVNYDSASRAVDENPATGTESSMANVVRNGPDGNQISYDLGFSAGSTVQINGRYSRVEPEGCNIREVEAESRVDDQGRLIQYYEEERPASKFDVHREDRPMQHKDELSVLETEGSTVMAPSSITLKLARVLMQRCGFFLSRGPQDRFVDHHSLGDVSIGIYEACDRFSIDPSLAEEMRLKLGEEYERGLTNCLLLFGVFDHVRKRCGIREAIKKLTEHLMDVENRQKVAILWSSCMKELVETVFITD